MGLRRLITFAQTGMTDAEIKGYVDLLGGGKWRTIPGASCRMTDILNYVRDIGQDFGIAFDRLDSAGDVDSGHVVMGRVFDGRLKLTDYQMRPNGQDTTAEELILENLCSAVFYFPQGT